MIQASTTEQHTTEPRRSECRDDDESGRSALSHAQYPMAYQRKPFSALLKDITIEYLSSRPIEDERDGFRIRVTKII